MTKSYNDWLTEELLEVLLESTSGPSTTLGQTGATSSPTSIFGHDTDDLRASDSRLPVAEKEGKSSKKKEIKLTWDTLPQPSVTELQWADPTSAERAELERFLNKVAPGKNLGEKLAKIQGVIEDGFSKGTAMSTVLSYLVFLKTLTYIITSFNSASAGFTFESFLGVLLGGEQIPTGQDTIADYKTGKGEYVSLKLLGVKGSEGTDSESTIDGSFTQLINDLSGASINSGGKMKYVIALKDLQGEGDKLGGTITVYEFTFSRDNLAELMSLTPKSRAAFSLMNEASRDLWTTEDYKFEFEDFLERRFVQQQEISEKDIAAISKNLLSLSASPKRDLEKLLQVLSQLGLSSASEKAQAKMEDKTNKDQRKQAMAQITKAVGESPQFKKALSKYVYARAYDTVAAAADVKAWNDLPAKDREKTKKPELNDGAWSRGKKLDPVDTQVKAAVNAIWNAETRDMQTRAKSAEKKKEKLQPMSFEDSVAELSGIKNDRDYYDHIKKYSMGYGSKGEPQFQIRQPHVTGGDAGTGQPIGKLTVGRSSVEEALKQSVNDINEKMFEAFNKMNELSTSLQSFFLNGLRSAEGEQAITATKGIAKDTDTIMKQKAKK